MKNLVFVFTLALLAVPLQGQQGFQVNLSHFSFQEKQGGSLIFPAGAWGPSTSASVNLGFNFSFLDSSFSRFDIEASGRIVFDAAHKYWLDLNTIAWIQSSSSSQVSLIYETAWDGTAIVTIQFKEVALVDAPQKRLSYQISFYESDQSVAFHMGPHDSLSFSDFELGPFLAYAKLDNINTMHFEQYHCWYRDSANLQDTMIYNATFPQFMSKEVESIWASGTRIHLSPKSYQASLDDGKYVECFFIQSKKEFVHPFAQIVLKVHRMDGSRSHVVRSQQSSIDLSFLKPGIYLLEWEELGETKTQKILIK